MYISYFIDMLDEFDGGVRTLATAGIWSTYPHKGVSHGTGFGDQVQQVFL